MSKLVVRAFSISQDGYGAGPNQSLENPLGENGEKLHEWFFETHTFKTMLGQEGGLKDVDEEFAARSFDNLGAWILGRNMFGPVRGPWPDESWKGWWGNNPPYHVPVFVLTHHARAPISMEGGTTFHFVTGGIEDALAQARQAAAGKDVRVGGGVETLKQYLKARLVDDLHLAVSPFLLGSGENLFSDIDLTALGYRITDRVPTQKATHLTIVREGI
ncbi:dihydrofolate reductase family protein [Mesorhizobium sp. 1M-11]|uniref:dihydrofolate reductase family protein n=1 Tax=Mesorhizobium sp. 1M-11 TaxID=1529006 RepID=UPI0006C746DD|nr:dihydrofolate reductase family protein [Mesorhizobium sp. 1M-11]